MAYEDLIAILNKTYNVRNDLDEAEIGKALHYAEKNCGDYFPLTKLLNDLRDSSEKSKIDQDATDSDVKRLCDYLNRTVDEASGFDQLRADHFFDELIREAEKTAGWAAIQNEGLADSLKRDPHSPGVRLTDGDMNKLLTELGLATYVGYASLERPVDIQSAIRYRMDSNATIDIIPLLLHLPGHWVRALVRIDKSDPHSYTILIRYSDSLYEKAAMNKPCRENFERAVRSAIFEPSETKIRANEKRIEKNEELKKVNEARINEYKARIRGRIEENKALKRENEALKKDNISLKNAIEAYIKENKTHKKSKNEVSKKANEKRIRENKAHIDKNNACIQKNKAIKKANEKCMKEFKALKGDIKAFTQQNRALKAGNKNLREENATFQRVNESINLDFMHDSSLVNDNIQPKGDGWSCGYRALKSLVDDMYFVAPPCAANNTKFLRLKQFKMKIDEPNQGLTWLRNFVYDQVLGVPYLFALIDRHLADLAQPDDEGTEDGDEVQRVIEITNQFKENFEKAAGEQEQLRLIRDYEKDITAKTLSRRVWQAVKTIIFAAVGFVLGMFIGGSIGAGLGVWVGPGAAFTTAIGMFAGAVKGAAFGMALASLNLGAFFAGTAGFFGNRNTKTKVDKASEHIIEDCEEVISFIAAVPA